MKNQIVKRYLGALMGVGLAGQMVNATPVTVPDYSFEATTNITAIGGRTPGPDVGPAWTGSGNAGIALQNVTNTLYINSTNAAILPPTAQGTNYLVEDISSTATARCWQTIGTLQTNTVYTLTVAVGNDLTGSDVGQGFIALLNGQGPFDPILASAPVDSSTVTSGTFSDFTLVFTNGYQASGKLTILLEGTGGSEIDFDNVRLDATSTPPAPEALPISVSPSNTVYQGAVMVLAENPSGTPSFTYQWQTDNGTAGASWSNTGGSSNSLAVNTSGFTPGTPEEYKVIVTSSSGSSTSAPVTLTAITGPPVVTSQTVPAVGSDTVGNSATFSAQFQGSLPISYQWYFQNLTGGPLTAVLHGTNATLTVNNLQLTDSGTYYLEATNAFGGAVDSDQVSFLVTNAVAAPDGVLVSEGSQSGLGGNTLYTPTWVPATNGDLLLGLSPTYASGGFGLGGCEGTSALTTGVLGFLTPPGNGGDALATGGYQNSENYVEDASAGPPGANLAYQLPATTNGWDLTNITVYGGWSDTGRDWQRYVLYYSTTANPTNYDNQIANVIFEPLNTEIDGVTVAIAGQQSATRVMITSTNGVLGHNIAGLKFDFTPLSSAAENGWEGYAQIQAFGKPSASLPIAGPIAPASGFDVVGSQVSFTADFSSSTPLALQWLKNGVPIPGATNTTLTLTDLQLTDTATNAGYSLLASNVAGVVVSSPCAFQVNPAPTPDGYNVLESLSGQTGSGPTFTPTWPVASNSLIAGLLPSSAKYGAGSFEHNGNDSAGGVTFLTDGQFGSVGSGNNSTMAMAGNGGCGQGLIYILPGGSAGGYTISNIVTYGGWSDEGRDAQAYTVSYSTVTSPATFIQLDAVANGAPEQLITGTPNADRMTLSAADGGVLASNVYAVEFDFTTPTASGTQAGNQENGYSGYAELQVFGAPSAPIPSMAPSLEQDILPAAGSDVVGSSVTFTTVFDGTPPLTYQWYFNGNAITGATGPTLTLTNLQTANAGGYYVTAVNSYGNLSSSTSTFTVNAAPTPVNGTLDAQAYQIVESDSYASGDGTGFGFTPTWTLAPGSLIAGQLPSSESGNFENEDCQGVNYLTSGSAGKYGDDDLGLASIGPSGGTAITYTLTGSATGYDLNEIVLFGGWGDTGRDENQFQVSYSTASNPSTFVPLTTPQTTFDYNPGGTALPNAIRQTVTSATASPLAQKVAAVQFTFPSEENGWCGLGQIQLFGVPTVVSSQPRFTAISFSGGNLIVTGSSGTAGASYTVLSTTNLALPLSEWTTNTVGTFSTSGGFTNSILHNASPAQEFFLLRTP
jgi:hypothetical protein